MDIIFDDRTDCWSAMTTMTVGTYLEIAREPHEDQGGLSGQRDVLKTTSAKRIRDRMVDDIKHGTVLPPVVLGAVVADFASIGPESLSTERELLELISSAKISIIDGMQRTRALMDALAETPDVTQHQMRVEFWLASSVRALVYRMLILNTSQVPWTISRQLSVVFAPLLDELQSQVPDIDRIFRPDAPGRRVAPAQYSSDSLVELYIAFTLRKATFDTKEALSEEFSRLDFVENLAQPEFQEQFYETLANLARFDKAISRMEDTGEGTRFTKGRHVFDAQPARIGFVVAFALHILGRPGSSREPGERHSRMAELSSLMDALVARLNELAPPDLASFMCLDVLEETLDRRVGQVGRYERAVFLEAFKVLIEERFAVDTLEPCWRAN